MSDKTDDLVETTWTFIGHWNDDDRIVVEEIVEGQVVDDRDDDGEYPQGLWAASGTGVFQDQVMAEVIGEYEREYHDEDEATAAFQPSEDPDPKEGTMFRVISETQGLVWTGEDAERAEEVAVMVAVNTARTTYLQVGEKA